MRKPLVSLLTIALLAGVARMCAASEPNPRTAKRAVAESGDKKWTLVVLGDSILQGFPAQYAELLEEELGIEIDVRSYTVDSSQEMLELLRNGQPLRQDLSTADVVFFHVPRHWSGTYYPDPDTLGESAADRLRDCLPKALEAYKADVAAIIAEIVGLRSPFDALIRTMDIHGDWNVDRARCEGVQTLLNLYWSAANEYLTEAATASRIPVARVYDVFNGVSGNEDPLAKGYLRPDAPTLCTELGVGQLVRAVDELGLGYGLYFPYT